MALALGLAPAALLWAGPVFAAEDFPTDPGAFWDISAIDVLDGGDTAYTNWLATEWKKQEEFAKLKGWIKDYKVLSNLYPRKGEPDIYLVTVYDEFPDARKMIAQRSRHGILSEDQRELDAESGDRGKFRTILGSMMLQELKLN